MQYQRHPLVKPPLPVAEAVLAPAQLPADLTWDGVPRTVKVPILMYHYLSVPPASADIYRKDLSVAPDLFNAQLDRIQAEGYTTISLYELVNHLTTGQALPEKSLIITFDDGYRENYENAFPALKAHGMQYLFAGDGVYQRGTPRVYDVGYVARNAQCRYVGRSAWG